MEKTGKRKEIDSKTRLIHRLNRISGQLEAVRKLIENDAPLSDIQVGISTVEGAFDSLRHQIVCDYVTEEIRKGGGRCKDRDLDDLYRMLGRMMKRGGSK